MRISTIIIAKNEENSIADCIESVKEISDEIIVVDNGSTDRTSDVAKRLGARVFEHPARHASSRLQDVAGGKSNNFSELRNYGLQKIKGEWVFYIDADERVSDSLRENIKYQISNIKYQMSGFWVKRKNFYLGNNEWPHIERLQRLFKRESIKGWQGQLHETPIFQGQIGELEGFLMHYTHCDLSSMLAKTIEWSEIEAGLRFKSNHPKMTWWRFPRVMFSAFFDSYIRQKGFKAGTAGLIESMYQAFSIFITYARLWELQKKMKVEK